MLSSHLPLESIFRINFKMIKAYQLYHIHCSSKDKNILSYLNVPSSEIPKTLIDLKFSLKGSLSWIES